MAGHLSASRPVVGAFAPGRATKSRNLRRVYKPSGDYVRNRKIVAATKVSTTLLLGKAMPKGGKE